MPPLCSPVRSAFCHRLSSPPFVLLLVPLLSLFLTACNSTSWPDREPTVIENVEADTLLFWPAQQYALPGDMLTAEVRGLQRVYVCARVLQLEWTASDTGAGTYLRLQSRIELPAIPECALSTGLDTVLESTAPSAGRRVYLQSASGTLMDSLRVVAGTGAVENFTHIRDSIADTLAIFGRYVFRDSTTGHPRRVLSADTLATCETFQAAVYTRLNGGDTLQVQLRTLLANALPEAEFPACAGPHADTIVVVEDRYGETER